MIQPIRFQKAGKIMLVGYKCGKPDRSDPSNVIARNGVVQQITPNITINGSNISDGNSLWAAANQDTSIEGSVAVQFAFLPIELYAFIMGDSTEELQSQAFPIIDEEYVIPEVSPYTVKLGQTPIADSIILTDIDGDVWTKESSPAKGKYSISGETLSFASADAGTAIFINFDYQTDVVKFGLPKEPKRKACQLIISGEAAGEDEKLFNTALIVDKAKVTGAINPPPQGGEPQPVTVTFNVLKPRGQRRAVEYMATPLDDGCGQ